MRDLRVCFLGDSFVAGVGDPEHLGWVGRIAAGTPGLTAYNLGVRRETSDDVRARCSQECRPRLPAGCDGRVVVSFGVNDTTEEDGAARVPAARTAANLRAILGERAWPVLVVGPPAVADDRQNDRIAALDDVVERVCRDSGVPHVGVVGTLRAAPVWRREVARGDGAHPGAAGYRLLADLVRPQWSAWLADG